MSDLNKQGTSPKIGNGRKVLLMLALIFVLPFTTALLLHVLDIRPSGKSFGNLIAPPVSLTIPELKDAQGKSFTAASWLKKWNIVTVAYKDCDEQCLATLDLLSRVHISLNKDIKRVQRILLVTTTVNANTIADLQKKFPDLIILPNDGEMIKQFSNKFENAPELQGVYLVDPQGNLMMQYPQDFQPKELRGDLVRLLKNSWAG